MPILIGHVRILKIDQEKGSLNMLKPGIVNEFSEQSCSMGSSLDYYERIAQLPDSFRERILQALRDCIIYPEFKDDFEGEPGFRNSLMRDTTSKDEIFTLAPLLISRNFHKLLDMDLSFEFSVIVKAFLTQTANQLKKSYGLNDWHPVIMDALADCK